ncbi:MAG: restriction endonuclease subunit S [Candidatus Dormibacteraceae bacterium]
MKSERLRHVADIRVSNVDKKSVSGQVPVRLCNYTDVYYNERITAALQFMESTATPEQCIAFRLAAGDVLLTKDSETPDDIGVTAVVAEAIPHLLCGYHLAMVRPRPGVDGHYLRFALASSPVRSDLGSRANGITRFGLRSSVIGDVTVPLPTLNNQRAIADYLDRETARIDSLVKKKLQITNLITQRKRACIDSALRSPSAAGKRTRLKYAVRSIVDTAHKTAPDVEEGDYFVVRTTNVKAGRLTLEDAKYTDRAGFLEWTERGVPEVGDILFTREAPAGEACLVPPDLRLCIGQRMVWINLDREKIQPEFGLYSLYASLAQEYIGSLVRSSTVAHLNMSDISQIPIVIPPLSAQHNVVDLVSAETRRLDRLMAALADELSLLTERRQALITAAVNGQISIPGAA